MPPHPPAPRARDHIFVSLAALTFARLILNMGRRFAYPFLPAISRELGVPLGSVQNVMALNAGVGLLSPVFGPLSDRYGRKPVMVGALLMMSAAALAGALSPRFLLFAAVVLVFGLAQMVYSPTMQAAVGERVPYRRRALAIGATELSWAGALFVIAPLAGFLLARYGLSALLLVFAALALVAAALLWLLLPSERREQRDTNVAPQPVWRVYRGNAAALGALGYALLLSMANEIFFINYGAWMEQTFSLQLAALGLASTVIALAEMTGEGAVMALADRAGKRRMALIGALGSALVYPALPALATSLPATLAGVFVIFLCFEIAIVAALPLFTEVMPRARGAMMSGIVAANALGRLSGAVIGAALFRSTGSLALTGTAALVIGIGAALLMRRFVREPALAVELADG